MLLSALLSVFLAVLNPIDYGIKKAKSDIERYNILYKAHTEAVKQRCRISYSGIDTLSIQIPPNAKPIPLSYHTDFAGATIIVRNNRKLCYLFQLAEKTESISVSAYDIDKGKFTNYPELKSGKHILVIQDGKPWVKNRVGHKNGAIRKDILYIENGKSRNRAVMPYNNSQSNPICTYRELDGIPISIKNLILIRDSISSHVTKCFCLDNVDNVHISNIIVETKVNPYCLYGDGIFIFNNCTNLTMENVKIEGTYSSKDKYGYGINMDNVWNCSFSDLYGQALWGIFGNNNVNVAKLYDCNINRMDVHCYGRDISCYRCVFKNYYNQYSSVYGTILYDHCCFEDFVPYLNGGTYNAYVPVLIYMKDCDWIVTRKNNCIVDMWYPYDKQNAKEKEVMRQELTIRYKPIVKTKNLHVIFRDGETTYRMIKE